MKIFLFFPIILLSQSFYLLPDEETQLRNTLNKHIKNAKNNIYIFTSQIEDYTFTKILKHSAKNNIKIYIITEDSIPKENNAMHLSLFNNIFVYTIDTLKQNRQLNGTLICIDNKEMFLLSEDMNSEKQRQNYSFAIYRQEECIDTFKTLIPRSKMY